MEKTCSDKKADWRTEDVADWVTRYVSGSSNPDMREYGKRLMDPDGAEYMVENVAKEIRRFSLQNRRVLDIGAGFGWHALAMSLLGDCVVIANDIRRTMTDQIKCEMERLEEEGSSHQVQPTTGDICNLDLPEKSFDAIVCKQTIEHVHDLPRMFDTCYRLLRPNGLCIIGNDNNALNRSMRNSAKEMWKKRDASWEFIDLIKKRYPVENEDIEPYRYTRTRLIREANKELDDDTVHKLAVATAGMVEPDISNFAQQFSLGERMPEPPAFEWCRNPVTGEYCERLLHPYGVADELANRGFKVSVEHVFGRSPLRALNRVTFRPLSDLLFNIRPGFKIVARRL